MSYAPYQRNTSGIVFFGKQGSQPTFYSDSNFLVQDGAAGHIQAPNLIIGNGGNIGSVTDPDSIAIASNGNVTMSQSLSITGDLTVNGTTTTVNSTVVTIEDPIIILGQDSSSTNPYGSDTDDNRDRGVAFAWNINGNGPSLGFFGHDDSIQGFTYISSGTVTGEVFSGSPGWAVFHAVSGNLVGDVTGNADTATTLETTRIFAITGEGTAVAQNFNGGQNVSLPFALGSTAITNRTEAVTPDNADLILIYDDSTASLRKMTRANFVSGYVPYTGATADLDLGAFGLSASTGTFSGQIGLNGHAKIGGVSAGVAGVYEADGTTLGTLLVNQIGAVDHLNAIVFAAGCPWNAIRERQNRPVAFGFVDGYPAFQTSAGPLLVGFSGNGVHTPNGKGYGFGTAFNSADTWLKRVSAGVAGVYQTDSTTPGTFQAGTFNAQNSTTATEILTHKTYTSDTSREYQRTGYDATSGLYDVGVDYVGTAGGTNRGKRIGSVNAAGTFAGVTVETNGSLKVGNLTCTGGSPSEVSSTHRLTFRGSSDFIFYIGGNSFNVGPRAGGVASFGGPVTAAGKVSTPASTTSAASLSIAAGVAPTTPALGDIWHESDTLKYQDSTTTRTLATTDAISSGYVPYTGATAALDLGANSLTARSIDVANGNSFGVRFGGGISDIINDAGAIQFKVFGTSKGGFDYQRGLTLPAGLGIHFSTSSNVTTFGNYDTALVRDGAGALGLRNGTNAQAFSTYSTYTSATSFESLKIQSQTAGSYQIGSAIGSAGGTNRDLELGHWDSAGAFTAGLKVKTSGEVDIIGAGTTTFREYRMEFSRAGRNYISAKTVGGGLRFLVNGNADTVYSLWLDTDKTAKFSSTVFHAASTTSAASLNISAGVAPTTPTNGDIWHESDELLYRDSTVTQTIATKQYVDTSRMYSTEEYASTPSYNYFGFTTVDGFWKVNRFDVTTGAKTTAQDSNNGPGTYADLTEAWVDYLTLVYT